MTTTIADAQALIRTSWEQGLDCPCCGQRVQLYRRKLNSSMAYALICVARDTVTDQWLHVPTHRHLARLGGDFAKLRYWRLVEEKTGTRSEADGPHAGHWRITFRGRAFVSGKLAIPRYVWVYNRRVRRVGEQMTNIVTALGDRFSYPELMGHAPLPTTEQDTMQLALFTS